MKRELRLEAKGPPAVLLRPLGAADAEDLRSAKNAERRWFFHKDEITPAAQKTWFEGYLQRENDFLFAAEIGGVPAGFMGFRVANGQAEIYAVIARPGGPGREDLAPALKLLLQLIRNERPKRVFCRLVDGDPAREAFLKAGFRAAAKKEGWDEFEPAA